MTTRPRTLHLAGVRLADVRHLWPETGSAARPRDLQATIGVAIHHDGVAFTALTVTDEVARIQANHRHSLAQGWGSYPYHLTATPAGRLYYTLDLSLFGAHVARRNHELLGVCILGDYTTRPPTDAALCAAAAGAALCWKVLQRTVALHGHRDWARPSDPSQCPGDRWPTYKGKLISLANHHMR